MEKYLKSRTQKKAKEKKVKNFPLKDAGADQKAPAVKYTPGSAGSKSFLQQRKSA